jgi:hypothetical protein
LERYRTGVGELEPETSVAELVLTLVQQVGFGPGRRGLGRRVNAAGPDKRCVESRVRYEARLTDEHRPAILEKQRRAVGAECDTVVAATEQDATELRSGTGIDLNRGTSVERRKLVEPDRTSCRHFPTTPGWKDVAQFLHNLVEIQMSGNEIDEGRAAAR